MHVKKPTAEFLKLMATLTGKLSGQKDSSGESKNNHHAFWLRN